MRNLNLNVLKEVVKGINFEVVEDPKQIDYGVINIRFDRDLTEEEVSRLSKEWLPGVKLDGKKQFVCCWGGGNVLCNNELGLNFREDEKEVLWFDDDFGYCGYSNFTEYWKDVKGKIVGLDRYEESIELY